MTKKGAIPQQLTLIHLPGGRVGDPIIYGNVRTDVHAYPRGWGEIVFKVRQRRVLPDACDKELGEWFSERDLQDVMRGAYQAQRRIRKRRRLLWRGILWW